MSSTSEAPRLADRSCCPWLHLFRAGGLACGWPQLAISLCAMLVVWMSSAALDWFFADQRQPASQLVLISLSAEGIAPEVTDSWWTTAMVVRPVQILSLPWMSVSASLSQLVWDHPVFELGSAAQQRWAALIRLVWNVALWTFFGTAICRAMAVQIARDGNDSVRDCSRYAGRRWLQAIGAPALPAGAILGIALCLAGMAWLGRLPLVGVPLLTVLSPILFLGGMAVAFFVLVIICGWPFMVAAIGVEDCDGFGALSRTYSFLTGRPGYAAGNAAVSVIYGGVLVLLLGGLCTAGLLALSRVVHGNIGMPERWLSLMGWSHWCAQFLLATFAVSLFWSLATLNYLLLRQAVDGVLFQDIAPGVDESSRRGELPIVGMAATDVSQNLRGQQLTVSEAEAVSPASPT